VPNATSAEKRERPHASAQRPAPFGVDQEQCAPPITIRNPDCAPPPEHPQRFDPSTPASAPDLESNGPDLPEIEPDPNDLCGSQPATENEPAQDDRGRSQPATAFTLTPDLYERARYLYNTLISIARRTPDPSAQPHNHEHETETTSSAKPLPSTCNPHPATNLQPSSNKSQSLPMPSAKAGRGKQAESDQEPPTQSSMPQARSQGPHSLPMSSLALDPTQPASTQTLPTLRSTTRGSRKSQYLPMSSPANGLGKQPTLAQPPSDSRLKTPDS
jgi:hypothetical protein